ncbi:superoxide dismutase family protein [Saccharicrinis sp. FJH54]|uniref:superoxide dismutase family protein n=1 Tax=Saccharicrinis sp. FJH54 TaxID=3344665 RepID=UPI0035D41BA9
MKRKNNLITGLVLATFFFVAQSCNLFAGKNKSDESLDNLQTAMEMKSENITKAVCVLAPTEGNDVKGTVTFTKTASGIKIVADVEGLTPGKHGFHVHEYGDITGKDGKTTGGHFNPDGMKHGAPGDKERHVGDLGNLVAGPDGKAHYERVDHVVSFSGDHSIIGRAIIVHAGEDDLKSQPTGAAGARVAEGVIGIAKE